MFAALFRNMQYSPIFAFAGVQRFHSVVSFGGCAAHVIEYIRIELQPGRELVEKLPSALRHRPGFSGEALMAELEFSHSNLTLQDRFHCEGVARQQHSVHSIPCAGFFITWPALQGLICNVVSRLCLVLSVVLPQASKQTDVGCREQSASSTVVNESSCLGRRWYSATYPAMGPPQGLQFGELGGEFVRWFWVVPSCCL
jgi:hypothetical protein